MVWTGTPHNPPELKPFPRTRQEQKKAVQALPKWLSPATRKLFLFFYNSFIIKSGIGPHAYPNQIPAKERMNFSTELLKPASIVLLQFRNQTNASERLFLADLQSVTDSKRKKLSFSEKVPLFIRLLKRDSASTCNELYKRGFVPPLPPFPRKKFSTCFHGAFRNRRRAEWLPRAFWNMSWTNSAMKPYVPR